MLRGMLPFDVGAVQTSSGSALGAAAEGVARSHPQRKRKMAINPKRGTASHISLTPRFSGVTWRVGDTWNRFNGFGREGVLPSADAFESTRSKALANR